MKENINFWKQLDITAKFSQLKTLRSLLVDPISMTETSHRDVNFLNRNQHVIKAIIRHREQMLAEDLVALLRDDVFDGNSDRWREFEASM